MFSSASLACSHHSMSHHSRCTVSTQQHQAPYLHRFPARRLVVGRAGKDQDQPELMTLEKAYKIIGVSASSSFERVLEAKNKAVQQNQGKHEALMEIETAYDLLLMQSMKKRFSGELEVSTSVRYADVPPAPAKKAYQRNSGSSSSLPRAPSLPKLPTNGMNALGVSIMPPRNKTVAATQAAVFAGLGTWALVQAVLQTPEAQISETAGLPLALALAYSIYSLKENKGMPLGKAAVASLGCVLTGALLGNLVESWLRVDIVPILGFSSPGTLVTEFIIGAVAAGAVFLV